jgi:hypothetical protein
MQPTVTLRSASGRLLTSRRFGSNGWPLTDEPAPTLTEETAAARTSRRRVDEPLARRWFCRRQARLFFSDGRLPATPSPRLTPGMTFDPLFLCQLCAMHIDGDPNSAREWYEYARDTRRPDLFVVYRP